MKKKVVQTGSQKHSKDNDDDGDYLSSSTEDWIANNNDGNDETYAHGASQEVMIVMMANLKKDIELLRMKAEGSPTKNMEKYLELMRMSDQQWILKDW